MARVEAANTVIIITDFAKARIYITMLVKIKYEVGRLFEIAKTCAVAPCTILFTNKVRSEDDLPPEILVPVQTALRCRIIDYLK